MGMSFITSLNMDGEMTGSQSLGNSGSWPLSITFLSRSQRLNDSRGGSIPERTQRQQRQAGTSRGPPPGSTTVGGLPPGVKERNAPSR